MSPRERAYRMAAEEQIIRREMPQFSFYDRTGRTYVQGWQGTQLGCLYCQLTLTIPSGYPDDMPRLYVSSPRTLQRYDGGTLNEMGATHSFHTLSNGQDGCVQICHCKPELWHASRTIISVMFKGILWITAYDMHLASGDDIAKFMLTQGT